jgi:hypothetical protein
MNRTAAALALLVGLFPVLARPQSSVISQIAGPKVATEKVHFSLKFGLGVTYLTGAAEAERSGGFDVGISATFKLTDRLSLTPEITPFARKGVATIPFDTTGDPALDPYFADPSASALDLTYTDIPVLLKYRLGRFHVGAGPYVAFLMSAAERFRAETASGEELRFKREVTDAYAKTDLGLAAEASWTVAKPRRGMGLIVHVRYLAGFLDVRAAPPAGGARRNSVIQAYLSFPFVL